MPAGTPLILAGRSRLHLYQRPGGGIPRTAVTFDVTGLGFDLAAPTQRQATA
jgi:hypothetical protein